MSSAAVPVPDALGVGVIGAGGFAQFVVHAARELADVEIVAVTDTDAGRAERLATSCSAVPAPDPDALFADARVQAVIIATPPDTHASLSLRALAAGKHVFCEKPVALSESDALAVEVAVASTGLSYVVDHVLRYNPVLAAMMRLSEAGLLGAVQRFSFENDAVDEDLGPQHWFWDEAISGGILLEHGVHFFDAAAMLIGSPALAVQAMGSARPDGHTDTVVCTVAHSSGALATHAHGFSHPLRAERQLMRVDYGLAEARIHGWIPLRADVDLWTDRADDLESLTAETEQLLAVPGVRPSGRESVRLSVHRDSASSLARSRGASIRAPHHASLQLDLGFPDAKDRVYRESVRAALADLGICVRTGAQPRGSIAAGRAAVAVAAAGTRSLHDHRSHDVRASPA